MAPDRFDEYCRQKVAEAVAADLPGFTTIIDEVASHRAGGVLAVESAWTRALFDGPFYRTSTSATGSIVTLVFVQSLDGNTGAPDPETLGGGATDKHLIYEGLSRIDADAVLAGARTARSTRLVFSVWHPELVALRLALGCPRHPAQVIVSATGDLPFEKALMFQVPDLRVFIATTSPVAERLRRTLRDRPWVEVIDAGEPLSMTAMMMQLAERGITIVSAVGGSQTASALIREHLVSDVYLTTAADPGGEPGTPFYHGPPLTLVPLVIKAGRAQEAGVRFEHLRLTR